MQVGLTKLTSTIVFQFSFSSGSPEVSGFNLALVITINICNFVHHRFLLDVFQIPPHRQALTLAEIIKTVYKFQKNIRMRKNTIIHYANTIYYCPNCDKNDLLYQELEEEKNKFFIWTISQKIIVNRIYCERCKFDIDRENLKIVKTSFLSNDTMKKTIEKETFFHNDNGTTTTTVITDYSEYIPKVKNKTLYFDMVFMLIDYIETHQDINVENNKFYQLAVEHTTLNAEEFYEEFEDKIKAKFSDCIKEFTQSELNRLLSNSLNVLKGQLIINEKVQKIYFDIFSLMKIGNLNHESFFRNLR
jgi:hypothetical protein